MVLDGFSVYNREDESTCNCMCNSNVLTYPSCVE